MSASAASDQSTRLALPILMSVVFLSLIGTGIVIPLLPFYGEVFQAHAWQITLMFAVYAAGQFVGELFWGRLSDRVRRKPVIVVTIFVAGLCYLALAYAPNIWAAIAARAVAGLFAGNTSTIQGYIVDVSPPDRVSSRLGMIGAALGLGFVVGPTLGGLLARPELGAAGFRPPLLVAAVLCCLSAVGVALLVREAPGRAASTAKRPGLIQALRNTLSDPVQQRLTATTFLSFAGFSSMWSTFGLWGAERFDWDPKQIGVVMALIGVASAASQGVFSGWASRRFGEARTVIVGLSAAAIFLLAQLVQWPDWFAVIVAILIVICHTTAQPANAALVARAAPPGQHGATLGANNSANAASRVLGPMAAGFLFSTLGSWSPLLLGCAMMAAAAAMAWAGSRALARRTIERRQADAA